MNRSKLLKIISASVVIILLSGVYFVAVYVHFFSDTEFVLDREMIPWEVADRKINDELIRCENDFEKVCTIREFAYSHIDWSSEANWNLGDSSISDIYNYYEADLGGGYCGLAARYLVKLYDYYGFKSCTYDMGEPENEATHVTVVVQIKYNGETVNTIQDPTFNFTVTDSISQPLDLLDIMQRIINRESDFRILESDANVYTEYLTNVRFVIKMNWNYILGYTKISLSNGQKFRYSLKTKRTLQRYVECLGNRYFKAFDKYNLPRSMS